jgi:hypothetical protein
MSKRAVSDAFDGPDAIEKAAVEAALNRCRVPPGRVVRGIRRAFYANPGRELTTWQDMSRTWPHGRV